ncbi:MAG: sigma 54-interacting transcriptional regulator [Terriglobales bacterium]
MALHPAERVRYFPEKAPVELDPIQRALGDNEDWYRDLVEHSQDLLCIHDLQGRLLSVNPAPARVLGYSVEELLQIPLREVIAPEFRDQFDAYLSQIKQTGESRGLMAVVTRSGERRIWEYHNTLRTEGVASPIVRGLAHDVTEQRRAERRLREASEFNRQIIASASEGVAAYDCNLRCLAWNAFMEELTGLTAGMALGKPHHDLCHEVTSALERALQGEPITLPDLKPAGRDSQRWISCRISPLRNPEREITGAIVMVGDVTERKRTEKRLQEYARVVEGLDEMIAVLDREYRYLIANHAFLKYKGLSRERVIGHSVGDVLGQEAFETNVKPKLDECFQGKVVRYEMRDRYPQLGERDLLLSYFPIAGSTGIDRVAAILQDITERKRAEERLREYEKVVEGLEEMIVVVDRDYRYLIANHAFLKYREMEREQVVGHLVAEVVSTEIFETVIKNKMDECFEGQVVRYELRYTFPNLGERDIFASYFPIEGPNGVERLALVLQDVTERKRAEEELRLAREKLAEEKIYLEEEIDTELGFGEIIGQSKALRAVMEQVTKVAASDAAVLILGETGTGKELVARAIHRMSTRQRNSFIKMNCAAIPSGLLESELFGHEKGAFTGAVSKKIGRLELADRGTLFLDEIGEVPLALQPKLLRVLQDQEFERLGSTHTLKVNFRLIAATNQDLSQRVSERQFRSDLYYRLNVFPVRVPPLRERPEDIPLLTEHFVRKCATRMNKSITSIPKKTMDALKQWTWPGNVRELENFVERSVILTYGSVLLAPLKELEAVTTDNGTDDTLEAVAREHILRALQQSHGRLSGPSGAAARLGMNRTTLQSKLKRLGIDHQQYRD